MRKLLSTTSRNVDVDVALNINVGDGGEDGRISWNQGPESTDYLPLRLTMFQNKATSMAAGGYANEILRAPKPGVKSELKSKVEEILASNGAYIVFTTQKLNHLEKTERVTAIRKRLEELEKPYASTCTLDIYDASTIAGWVNNFISAVVSVQAWLGKPMERGLKTYRTWSEHEELESLPFFSVPSRTELVETLKLDISTPRSCFRIVGLSGLGKTRTAHQVFVENETLRSLVVYIDANICQNVAALCSGLGDYWL